VRITGSLVQFAPTEVKDFEAALNEGIAKIVGVSDDLALVARAEKAIQDEVSKLLRSSITSLPRE
jgi:hypothetical protein